MTAPRTLPPRGRAGLAAAAALVTILSVCAREMNAGPARRVTADWLPRTHVFPDNDHRVPDRYTGIPAADFLFKLLLNMFLPPVAGWLRPAQLQLVQLLGQLMPVLAAMTVEAERSGRNKWWMVTKYTSIWAVFYQSIGGAIVFPVYVLAYLCESRQPGYWAPASQRVSPVFARTLLPAFVVAYLVPLVAKMLPAMLHYPDPGLRFTQSVMILWQVSPLVVNAILGVAKAGIRDEKTGSETEKKAKGMAGKKTSPADSWPETVGILKQAYLAGFLVAAVSHFGVLLTCLSKGEPGFAEVMVPNMKAVFGPAGEIGPYEANMHIFQMDFWGIYLTMLLWALVSFRDLKALGKTSMPPAKTAALLAAGAVVFGPGAAFALAWYVREDILAAGGGDAVGVMVDNSG